jgi:molybdenum cofactor biosynthesis protein B
VDGVLDKEIRGFGELFRMLSYEEVGAAAMLSRAIAGVADDRVVFSIPGSTKAVELAMTKLIIPEIGHIVGLVRGSR